MEVETMLPPFLASGLDIHDDGEVGVEGGESDDDGHGGGDADSTAEVDIEVASPPIEVGAGLSGASLQTGPMSGQLPR